jgi:hypothetical protein
LLLLGFKGLIKNKCGAEGTATHTSIMLALTPTTHWIGVYVGHRANLDAEAKRKIVPLPGIELVIQPVD